MGKGDQKGELNEALLELFAITIELHPVMQAYNLGIRGGTIFLLENIKEFDTIQNHLQKAGIKITKITNPASLETTTNGLCVYNYNLYDKPQNILQFLNSKSRAIPSVVVLNAMPVCLQDASNVIPFSRINPGNHTGNKQMNAKQFIEYARLNPKWLCDTLKSFHSCKVYEENDSESSLIIALKTSAYLFANFYRLSNSESETNFLLQHLIDNIKYFEDVIDTYTTDVDILFAFRKIFKKYVNSNHEIIVADLDNINGMAYEALTKDFAIVYDEDYYFIPEFLLKKACEPLKTVVSFLNIKKMLYQENVLSTNTNEAGGYTVKKVIVSSYGIIVRPRFLKIRRDFFTSVSEPNVEEKGGTFPCT